MSEQLSDANLRAVLVVVLRRNNGVLEMSNAELYDAMLPAGGLAEQPFTVEQTVAGLRVTLREHESDANGGSPA